MFRDKLYPFIDPTDLSAPATLCLFVRGTGFYYLSALFYFEKAVSLKADYTDALNNIGSVYGNKGQFQKALSYFEKSYAVDPNNVMTNRFIGMTWNNLGNQVMGTQFLQRAEELKNNN